MTPDENAPAPVEVPIAEIPPANPAPAAPAAPPATAVVLAGTKTEREIELERRLTETEEKMNRIEREKREAEILAAEKQRDADAISRKYNEKRKVKGWTDPVFED